MERVRFSGRRFAVRYGLTGSEREARQKAETLCLDQTVELPSERIPAGFVREEVVGRIEELTARGGDRYEVVVSFATELLEPTFTQLLNLVFGIASLRGGIRVLRLELPDDVLGQWSGSRWGRAGLRELVGIRDRPLVCGVLKPLGLAPRELADLARALVLGGLDLVKDDQALVNHVFCRFEERVGRCAEAVAEASRERGRPCLYVPHVTAPWETMRERSRRAQELGAGGLLLCPGLVGFDSLRALTRDGTLHLPVISHPGFLGAYTVPAEHGIAPSVLFGQLPRLAGADATIYPSDASGFPISRDECRTIAEETGAPWGHVKAIFPTAAGRMSEDRIRDAWELYQRDVIVIVGGRFTGSPGRVRRSCESFMEQVAACARSG